MKTRTNIKAGYKEQVVNDKVKTIKQQAMESRLEALEGQMSSIWRLMRVFHGDFDA